MMKNRVFFYMSSGFHNAYRHMAKNPPEGFTYQISQDMAYAKAAGAAGAISPGLGTRLKGALKGLSPGISPLYNDLLIKFNKPKVRKFDAAGFDLVHSGQSLLETSAPYVADFEHAAAFCGFNQYALERPGFAKALAKALLNKNLKKLLPWSEAAKKSLLNFVDGNGLAEKVEVVYTPITPPEGFEKKKHAGVNFVFIGNVFYEKGGYETMLAFDRISEKHDTTLTIISDPPEEVKRELSKNQKIRVLGRQPYEAVKEIYREMDVMVFPTHYDTYGFVIPEAMSYGLPVVGVDSFSSPELIEHERTGLIVKSFYSSFREDFGYRYPTLAELGRRRAMECKNPTREYVNELAVAMERLIEDGPLRRRLSGNAKKETLGGKFSVKAWKEKSKRIYEEALRN